MALGHARINRFSRNNEERYWRFVQKGAGDACWEWLGGKDSQGYGYIWWRTDGRGRVMKASRVAVFLATGQWIPARLCACHHCDNPGCVNPAHLFVGTRTDNQQDSKRKGRKRNGRGEWRQCVRGHEFTPDNTYLNNGKRGCRKCRSDYSRRRVRRNMGR